MSDQLSDILNTPIVKRSVNIAGHATSVSIEKPFWEAFKNIASAQKKSINQLTTEIDNARPKYKNINLSSAIRLYVLNVLSMKEAI